MLFAKTVRPFPYSETETGLSDIKRINIAHETGMIFSVSFINSLIWIVSFAKCDIDFSNLSVIMVSEEAPPTNMFEIAQNAVSEFSGEMKYVKWLANMEYDIALALTNKYTSPILWNYEREWIADIELVRNNSLDYFNYRTGLHIFDPLRER